MIKKLLMPLGMFAGTTAFILFCIHPCNKRKHIMKKRFGKYYIAHRGLFDNPHIPENSMPAFKAAIKEGYAIELDIQLTSDNRLVVFHDETLQRMCNDPRTLRQLSYKDLIQLNLLDSGEKIPLFKDVLNMVNGRVPLFVEIKPEGRFLENARRTAAVLKKYNGIFCVQSFNPFVLLSFRKHSPKVLRGQLSSDFKKDGDTHSPILQFIMSNLLFNCFSRPDFISYNHLHSNRMAFQICSRLFKSLNAAWTIRNRKELEKAEKDFDFFIFESFRP